MDNRSRLRALVRRGHRRSGVSQQRVAERLGISAGQYSRVIKGERPLKLGVLGVLVRELGLDWIEALDAVLWRQSRSASQEERSGLRFLHGRLADCASRQLWAPRPRGILTLREWPHMDLQAVIVGDRRDRPPRLEADLLALSASIGDLFFLCDLRQQLKIWFDKFVREATTALNCNLLVVGSPAVNLAAREINGESCFRFTIDPRATALEAVFKKELKQVESHRLTQYYEDLEDQRRRDLEGMRRDFKGNGFEDPLFGHIGAGEAYNHYGIVSLAQHPYWPGRVAVFAAGTHGAATAASLRLLADPNRFQERPLGGVFRVVVPEDRPWFDRWESLDPVWVTEGYSIDTYLEAIQGRAEWEAMRDLIELLEQLASAGGDPAGETTS